MKKIIKSLILCIMLFVVVAVRINIKAATGDVYNIVTCPGEDMATQMQINWQSPTSITGLKVEYTEASDASFANAKTVDAVSREFSRKDGDPVNGASYVGFSTPRKIWNVALNDLKPTTKYIYRITNGSKVYSSNYAFETCSQTDDVFSFLFMTDPQYYSESGASKFNVMTEKHIVDSNVKFAFITGDISDKGGNSSYWDMFYTKSSLSKIPFATTVGNHEYYDSGTVTTDNLIYNQYFFNPQNGPEHVKGSSYYFVYNKALFIMLDSEDKANIAEQQEWFRNVCESVQCSYIIVGCHKSAYPAGPYVSDGKYFMSYWGTIFDECQVDLVLSGHDHVFTRTKPVYAGKVTSEKYAGTVYIEGGSAGDKYYGVQSQENADKWAAIVEKTTCATVITLGKEQFSTKTYNYSGNLIDSSYTSRKRFGEYDESYTAEEFEKSFKVETKEGDLTSGTISWSEKGYGHVKSLSVTHVNSDYNLGNVIFINNLCTSINVKSKFWVGEVNEFKVDIKYTDGTSSTVNLSLDNRVEWGKINSVEAVDVTSRTFNLLLNVDLNLDIKYLHSIRVVEGSTLKKSYTFKDEDFDPNQIFIEIKNKLMEPDSTYTYKIQILSVNKVVIWEQELVVNSKRELTEEQEYQEKIANIAFQSMIDNLLKSLGINPEE